MLLFRHVVAAVLIIIRSAAATNQCLIATAAVTTCMVAERGGKVVCIGDASDGKTSPPTTRGWASLAGGGYVMCGIDAANASIACWGAFAQVSGAPTGQETPPPGKRWAEVAVGNVHSCGVEEGSGELWCWGYNDDGRSTAPMGTGYSHVAASHHSCAIAANGAIVCFGPSGNGQTAAPSGETFADVCTGTLYSCGLSTAGFISCWGDNTNRCVLLINLCYISCESFSPFDSLLPLISPWSRRDLLAEHSELTHPNASSGQRFSSISCGSKYACGVHVEEQGGRASCWGLNDKVSLFDGPFLFTVTFRANPANNFDSPPSYILF